MREEDRRLVFCSFQILLKPMKKPGIPNDVFPIEAYDEMDSLEVEAPGGGKAGESFLAWHRASEEDKGVVSFFTTLGKGVVIAKSCSSPFVEEFVVAVLINNRNWSGDS
jgi:hypothetical protein